MLGICHGAGNSQSFQSCDLANLLLLSAKCVISQLCLSRLGLRWTPVRSSQRASDNDLSLGAADRSASISRLWIINALNYLRVRNNAESRY